MPKQNRWIDITDPVGRELLGCAADLKARLILVNLSESIYEGPGKIRENAAVATLLHAYDYLRDRIGYEMDPAPKGMVRVPGEVPQ
jgi:hypothetical protein